MSATDWTPSLSLFSSISSAILGASAGTEKTAACNAVSTAFSTSWKLEIFDGGELVGTFTYDEAFPVTSGALAFSNTPSTSSIDAGGIDSTSVTLTAKISSVSNASLYMETSSVGTNPGNLVKLSGDINTATTPEILGSITYTDDIVTDGGGGSSLPDLAVAKYKIDPRETFAANPPSLVESMSNSGGSSTAFSTITEPGILYASDGKYRLERVSDPIKGASYKAYKRYVAKTDSLPWDSVSSVRNETSDGASTQTVASGQEMMVALASTRPDYDGWNLTPAWYNWYNIWQLHAYDGAAPVLRLTRANNGGVLFLIANDTNVDGIEHSIAGTTPNNVWEGWCIHFKLSATAGLGFTKVYRSVGLTSWSLVVDTTIANTKTSTAAMAHHLKMGFYSPLGQTQLAASPTNGMTAYDKGMYSYNLTINPGSTDLTKMLALLNAI